MAQMTPQELARAADRVREAGVRFTTWHWLSLWVARIVLIVFGSLWLRSYWHAIDPQFWGVVDGHLMTNVNLLTTGALDALLAVGMAIACSTVPSIFAAGLIPNSPASALLGGLEHKYGRAGWYFAFVGAIVFSVLGGFTLYSYWLSRPNVSGIDLTAAVPTPTDWGQREAILQTVASLFLMIGFPAWALNRMTPEQWVDAILQAREVARIQRILALEDMAEKAIMARARALLYADITKLTLEQRAANAKELSAIMSAAHRGIYVSLKQVGETFVSLHGMELMTQIEPDDAIIRRYKYLADTLTNAADDAEFYANQTDYIAREWQPPTASATANETASEGATIPVSRALVSHSGAETLDRDDSDCGPSRSATDREAGDGRDRERPRGRYSEKSLRALTNAIKLLYARFGPDQGWTRAQVEDALSIQKTKANDIIKSLLTEEIASKIDNPADHYQFVHHNNWPVYWQEVA